MFEINKWTKEDYENLTEYLKENADSKYRDFHSSLVPDNDKSSFIGVRMPFLRSLGREISKGDAKGFLNISQTEYYEQRILSGIVTGLVKPDSFEDFTSLVNAFVPQINSWAVCDCFCAGLKEVKRYEREFFKYICKFLQSPEPWKIRFALVVMLDYYLEDEYISDVLKRCDSVSSTEYYVSMAQAWLLATAYAKQRDAVHAYFLNNNLSDFTFNKAIQKCVESRRIAEKDKEFLKSLKRH